MTTKQVWSRPLKSNSGQAGAIPVTPHTKRMAPGDLYYAVATSMCSPLDLDKKSRPSVANMVVLLVPWACSVTITPAVDPFFFFFFCPCHLGDVLSKPTRSRYSYWLIPPRSELLGARRQWKFGNPLVANFETAFTPSCPVFSLCLSLSCVVSLSSTACMPACQFKLFSNGRYEEPFFFCSPSTTRQPTNFVSSLLLVLFSVPCLVFNVDPFPCCSVNHLSTTIVKDNHSDIFIGLGPKFDGALGLIPNGSPNC